VLGEIHTLTYKTDKLINKIGVVAIHIDNAAKQIKSDSDTAVEVVRKSRLSSTTNSIQWLIIGLLTIIASTLLVGWLCYLSGTDAGKYIGYSQAREEISAASWANTPNGRLAFQLNRNGSLEYLVNCSRPGWIAKDGVCYVFSSEIGVTYGWTLPK